MLSSPLGELAHNSLWVDAVLGESESGGTGDGNGAGSSADILMRNAALLGGAALSASTSWAKNRPIGAARMALPLLARGNGLPACCHGTPAATRRAAASTTLPPPTTRPSTNSVARREA
jgi:hypothetical protein